MAEWGVVRRGGYDAGRSKTPEGEGARNTHQEEGHVPDAHRPYAVNHTLLPYDFLRYAFHECGHPLVVHGRLAQPPVPHLGPGAEGARDPLGPLLHERRRLFVELAAEGAHRAAQVRPAGNDV